jgi:hypothetical protein
MMVPNMRYASLVIFVMSAACAARSAAPTAAPTAAPSAAPPASRAALEAKPVVWARRDPAVAVIPLTIERLQVIITPGWARGEHFAWLISNGTEVIRVYRCASTEIGEVVDAAIRTIYPTVGTPLDQASFVIVGSIHTPPPPPPDPSGFPGIYVEQVVRTAWNMNREQIQISGTVAVP